MTKKWFDHDVILYNSLLLLLFKLHKIQNLRGCKLQWICDYVCNYNYCSWSVIEHHMIQVYTFIFQPHNFRVSRKAIYLILIIVNSTSIDSSSIYYYYYYWAFLFSFSFILSTVHLFRCQFSQAETHAQNKKKKIIIKLKYILIFKA